jgi:hypothetical protein
MGLRSELEHADRFAAYVNELTKVLGHTDREKPFRDLLRRSAGDRGPTQRGADGSGDGSGTRFDAASEALAPCRQFPGVG